MASLFKHTIAGSFTSTMHSKPYAAISPSNPALSQEGKTVLVVGGTKGIGHAIARSFGYASASKVIILGRDPEGTTSTATELQKKFDKTKTEILGEVCDISDQSSIAALWSRLEQKGFIVDTLVLNAARFTHLGNLLEAGQSELRADLQTNFWAAMELVELFVKHIKQFPNGKKKAIVNVSTMIIHDTAFSKNQSTYCLSKNACALLLQIVAQETDLSEVQIVSFHPGAIFTPGAKSVGWTEDTIPWDDEDLPGNFAVWAASPEASFLHGRFVWASWDVDELKNGKIRERIDADPKLLKVGVNGL
ncbi:hypothetical protein F5884DRAFT_769348 [Xylogone sp. PMI_703]|nr:hypothetical protein F5884DRAFT_769348 [Xylogone sp. PMI_703]